MKTTKSCFSHSVVFASLLWCLLLPRAAFAQTFPFDFSVTRVIWSQEKDKFWKSPRGLFFQTQKKELYVSDTGNKRILVYDKEGVLLDSMDTYYGKQGEAHTFQEPKAVFVDDEDILYISDAKTILVLDLRGNLMDTIDGERCGETEIFPRGLHVDKSKQLYFVSGDKVFVLDKDRNLKLKFTKGGNEEEKLKSPEAITTDSKGIIYITDSQAYYGVHMFTKEGIPLHAFAEHGMGPDTVAFPSGIFVDAEERVWLVDTIRQHLIVFTTGGKFLTSVGEGGKEVGNFLFPVDISETGDTNPLKFYILEREGLRVQLFEARENPLLKAEVKPEQKTENKTSVTQEQKPIEAVKSLSKPKETQPVVTTKSAVVPKPGKIKTEATKSTLVPIKFSSFATYIISIEKGIVEFAYGKKDGKVPAGVYVWRGDKMIARIKVTRVKETSSEGKIIGLQKGVKIDPSDTITSYSDF